MIKRQRIKPRNIQKRNDLIYHLFVDDQEVMEDIADIFRLKTGFVNEIIRYQETKHLIISK